MVIILLPEIGARVVAKLTYTVPAKSAFLEIGQGYSQLNQLIKDWNVLRFNYHDYYMYSPAPAHSPTVNFSEYFGSRATPDSSKEHKPKEVIWAFGGSTMQNLETEDSLTLANQIALEFKRRNILARVYNFGVSSFQSSLETIKFQDLLRRVPVNEWPTTVLFYDGFNEVMFGYYFGAGTIQADLSLKMRDLVERDYPRLVLYMSSEFLSRYSAFWRNYIAHRITTTLYERQDYPGRGNLDQTVSVYVRNVRMTEGICKNFHIRCLFILQPLVATRSNPTTLEQSVIRSSIDGEYIKFTRQFYHEATRQLSSLEGFIDMSRIFDHDKEPHFFDMGHVEPFSGIILGKKIADSIMMSGEAVR
jgi:hypothetical protein